MKRHFRSQTPRNPEEQITGSWQSFNGGRILQLLIQKSEPITEWEFDEMIELVISDLRKAYLEQRFRPAPKKRLES